MGGIEKFHSRTVIENPDSAESRESVVRAWQFSETLGRENRILIETDRIRLPEAPYPSPPRQVFRPIGLRKVGADEPPRAGGGLLGLHPQRVIVLGQLILRRLRPLVVAPPIVCPCQLLGPSYGTHFLAALLGTSLERLAAEA
jgi:hypothetical protein